MTWQPPDAEAWREPEREPAEDFDRAWAEYHRRARTHWVLDGHEVREEPDLLTWARWLEKAERHVAEWQNDDYWVSTVFLGLDHSFGMGPAPILFETMIFARDELKRTRKALREGDLKALGEDARERFPLDGQMLRYATWAEAELGHRAVVEAILRGTLDADD